MVQGLRILLVSCIAFLLLACSEAKLTELRSGDVIVAFGDSLTEGVGTEIEHSYPSVLARLSGLNVINAGVSGETTREGLHRLPSVIEEFDPDLLILLEGGNDILRNHDFKEIESNLDQMIMDAKSAGVEVILIGVPEKRLFSNSAPFYQSLAEKHDLVFDTNIIGSLMRNPSKKSDSIHFNQEGYSLMAEHIYDLLKEHGAFR